MKTYLLLEPEARDRDDALRIMSRTLERSGAVKAGHGDSIVAREAQFPTGLPTAQVQVAIPHTGAGFTNFSALLFCRLKEAVPWDSMEEDGEPLAVRLVFMLALKQASEHTTVLCRLMELFQQPQLLQALCDVRDEGELRNILAF